MQFVDTHIHLDAEEFSYDREEVIHEAVKAGVTKLLLPNVDLTTHEKVIEVCRQFPEQCHPMSGLHPTSVKENWEAEVRTLMTGIDDGAYVAIGEIGIDLYWDKTYYAEQQKAFVMQMNIARDAGLPAVIHSRKSLDEIILLIQKEKLSDIPAVFHCFPGSVEQARRLCGMGYYLGIGGVVTFKNATMAEVVKEVPAEHLLLETDAPWLAPVPWRGKRNEPGYIAIIAQKIAELKEMDITEVAIKTTAAAASLFKKVPFA
jgi:TatD DNase family protein